MARAYRAGVYFDCPDCGRLWRDDAAHAPTANVTCAKCGGPLRLVGQGGKMVQEAQWFRCIGCQALYMRRRGETVPTTPRAGFDEFT